MTQSKLGLKTSPKIGLCALHSALGKICYSEDLGYTLSLGVRGKASGVFLNHYLRIIIDGLFLEYSKQTKHAASHMTFQRQQSKMLSSAKMREAYSHPYLSLVLSIIEVLHGPNVSFVFGSVKKRQYLMCAYIIRNYFLSSGRTFIDR